MTRVVPAGSSAPFRPASWWWVVLVFGAAVHASGQTNGFKLTFPYEAGDLADLAAVQNPPGWVATTSAVGRAASGSVQVGAGRYEVRFAVSASSFGRAETRVDCILHAAGQPELRRSLLGPDFPADGRPAVVAMEVTKTNAAPLQASVEWSGNKETVTNLPAIGDAAANDMPDTRWELAHLQVHAIESVRLD